jgi:hypothetical protein
MWGRGVGVHKKKLHVMRVLEVTFCDFIMELEQLMMAFYLILHLNLVLTVTDLCCQLSSQ